MTDARTSDDSADLVRLLGRTIMGVSLLTGIFIFLLSGVESGPSGLVWHPLPIGAAVGFFVSGLFAWGALRGIAQIRDRVAEAMEEG
jgi:hypothetical protein